MAFEGIVFAVVGSDGSMQLIQYGLQINIDNQLVTNKIINFIRC